MICSRCLLRIQPRALDASLQAPERLILSSLTLRRTYADQKQISVNTATSTAPRQGTPDASTPAATSTSAAQPFSTLMTPSPENAGVVRQQSKAAATTPSSVLSTVPAGTPLKGLNFLKNKQDPLALPDGEYPPWLWTLLRGEKSGGSDGDAEGDLYAKSKKQRRIAAKKLRKLQALEKNQPIKVHVTEQTIDLPRGDGTVQGAIEAGAARDELTKALRSKRRASIKESNFLKAMG